MAVVLSFIRATDNSPLQLSLSRIAAKLASSIRLPACRSVSEVRNKYLNINYLKYRLVFDAAPLDK